jgi:hypothetical protein
MSGIVLGLAYIIDAECNLAGLCSISASIRKYLVGWGRKLLQGKARMLTNQLFTPHQPWWPHLIRHHTSNIQKSSELMQFTDLHLKYLELCSDLNSVYFVSAAGLHNDH